MTHPETSPRIAGSVEEAVDIARELGWTVKIAPSHRSTGSFIVRDERSVRNAAASCILTSPTGEVEVSRHE